MIQVNLTGTERIKQAFAQLNEAAQSGVIRKVSQEAFNYAQDQADTHTKTGALARSAYIKSVKGGYAIGHDERMAPHAWFVHWGTKPHVIEPKNHKFPVFYQRKSKNGNIHTYRKVKKSLRWAGGNGYVYAGKVNHPGYKGHPWLEHAAKQLPQWLDNAMQQEINKL